MLYEVITLNYMKAIEEAGKAEETGRLQEAILSFRKALTYKPSDTTATAGITRIEARISNQQEKEALYKTHIRITSYNVCYTKLLREGDVVYAKINNVKLLDNTSDETSVIANLKKTDDLIYMGIEENGFVWVETEYGGGWVKKALITR